MYVVPLRAVCDGLPVVCVQLLLLLLLALLLLKWLLLLMLTKGSQLSKATSRSAGLPKDALGCRCAGRGKAEGTGGGR